MSQTRMTISDLARLAGVSTPTVSRALNGRRDVSATTREKVLRIAEEHGFRPNRQAASLRTGRFRMLGLLAPAHAWTWMPDVIRAVAEQADRRGYTLLLQPLDTHEEAERRFVEEALPMLPIDGLVMVIPPGSAPHVSAKFGEGLPVVVLDDQVRRDEYPSVEITNRASTREITEHLLQTGRSRIAFTAVLCEQLSAVERRAGYEDAVTAAGHTPLVIARDDEDQEKLIAELLRRTHEYDALVVAFDEVAVAVIAHLRAHGLRVPEDVAVTGFDDLPAAAAIDLTTVRSPFYDMGAAAAAGLIDQIEGASPERRIVLPAEIVLRGSSHPPAPAT